MIKKESDKYLDFCRCNREIIKKNTNYSDILTMSQMHEIYNNILFSDDADEEENYILCGKYVQIKLLDEDDYYKE